MSRNYYLTLFSKTDTTFLPSVMASIVAYYLQMAGQKEIVVSQPWI